MLLEGGTLETARGMQQASFHLLKASAQLPVVQRATARGTVPWLVQMAAAIRPQDHTALEAEGAVVHGYVPNNALLVEAAPAALARIAKMYNVNWAGEYLPLYKISRALADGSDADCACVVTLFDPADKRRVAREFGEMNVFVPRAQLEAAGTEFRVK